MQHLAHALAGLQDTEGIEEGTGPLVRHTHSEQEKLPAS